jgi:hypothetical protein
MIKFALLVAFLVIESGNINLKIDNLAQLQSINSGSIVTDSEGNTTTITSIVDNKSRLVLRIPRIYCKPCMIAEFMNVKKINLDFDSNRIIILTSFEITRDFISFSRAYCQDIPCYNIPDLKIMDEDRLDGNLYYFHLDEILKVDNIFYCDKQSPERSYDYLCTMHINKFKTRAKSNGYKCE